MKGAATDFIVHGRSLHCANQGPGAEAPPSTGKWADTAALA